MNLGVFSIQMAFKKNFIRTISNILKNRGIGILSPHKPSPNFNNYLFMTNPVSQSPPTFLLILQIILKQIPTIM